MNVTIQITPDMSDPSVEKFSLTVVSSALASCAALPPSSMESSAFPPCYQTYQRQSEQLQLAAIIWKYDS